MCNRCVGGAHCLPLGSVFVKEIIVIHIVRWVETGGLSFGEPAIVEACQVQLKLFLLLSNRF